MERKLMIFFKFLSNLAKRMYECKSDVKTTCTLVCFLPLGSSEPVRSTHINQNYTKPENLINCKD